MNHWPKIWLDTNLIFQKVESLKEWQSIIATAIERYRITGQAEARTFLLNAQQSGDNPNSYGYGSGFSGEALEARLIREGVEF